MKDILIIGGGIAGISTGARLAPHAKVVVLEAEEALAYHASGRSAALYEANYGMPSTIALARASGDFYRKDTDYLSPRGLMVLAKADEETAFRSDLDKMKLVEISIDEAAEKLPILNRDVVAFAGYQEKAWDIDTDRLIQDFAKTIRSHRGEIHLKSSVQSITQEGRWKVTTPSGVYEADILINAAGAWVDEIAAMAGIKPIGFTPNRRSVARIPAPDGLDPKSWPMFFGVNEGWYCKPDAGSLIVSPAEEDPTTPHDAWAEDMVLAEGLAKYEEMTTDEVTRLQSNWAGLRTFSPDRNLVIGPSTENPAFFWVAGQGGYGFLSAPAYSQLAADLILGNAPSLPDELVKLLSPERFAA